MKKSVVSIIVNKNNEVLLLKRPDNDRSYPSIYCLPGGKLEENELPPVGMIREVFEETGIRIREYTQYTIENGIYFYVSKLDNYDVKLSDEHVSYIITSDIDNNKLGPITHKVLKIFFENN
jgi:8-oxo-dGTP pyrophosphatase MutT (NUDIX family)